MINFASNFENCSSLFSLFCDVLDFRYIVQKCSDGIFDWNRDSDFILVGQSLRWLYIFFFFSKRDSIETIPIAFTKIDAESLIRSTSIERFNMERAVRN